MWFTTGLILDLNVLDLGMELDVISMMFNNKFFKYLLFKDGYESF